MTATGDTEPTTIGRYELTSVLGMGGFAAVHRAHDPALDADVALKVLLSQFVENEDIRQRFEQEARLLRRVDSPHLIRVYDVGEFDGRRPYFVMELAEGGVLSERVDGPVDAVSMAKVVDALSGGLGALHDANIVHRDIKPDNLLITGGTHGSPEGARFEATQISSSLLTDGERLVVGDLGLAKDHDRTSAGPTVAGGTPFYRSPEQMTRGANITPTADIYAATGVIWFLLAGSHPPEVDAIPLHLPAMPRAWQAFLERGLDPDPELRHCDVRGWALEARQAIAEGPETGLSGLSGFTDLSGFAGGIDVDGTAGALDVDGHADHQGAAGARNAPIIAGTENVCPYKGMAAFQPQDSGLFFGRADMIDALVTKLQTHPVMVIGGPSGSGKSSLMRAGLIPRVARGAIPGSQQWRIALFNPGSDVIGELLHQLRRLRSNTDTSGEELTRDDLPHGARRWLEDADSNAVEGSAGTLLAIDQFEELFTLNPNRADRELFLETLAVMTESAHSRVKVVLALRADFYGVCASHPWLNDRINENQLLVGPMSRQELRDAVTIPATRTGLRLEDGLADQILDDVGPGAGALPLLGHALMETWIRRRGSTLTMDGYHAAGGVSGAIAQRAEEIFTALSPEEQVVGRQLLLQLINPGQGTPDTRRRVTCNELPTEEGVVSVLEKLAAARLLTVDDQAAEVAHEALIQSWPRLRGWIDEDRENLQTRRRIGVAAAEWITQGENPDLLYRGTQLAAALEFDAEHGQELGQDASRFLDEARKTRDRAAQEEAAAEARTKRTRRLAVSALGTFAAVAVIASIAAFIALQRSQANERAAEASQVQALAAAASAAAADQPLVATELALEALARATPSTPEARGSLVDARVALHENRWLPQPFGDPVAVGDMLTLAATPDGATFITGSRSGDVVFWDRVSRTETHRLNDLHFPGVNALRVSDDGRWMVSAGGGTAVVWDLAAEPPEATPLHQFNSSTPQIIWDAMISPDGATIGLTTESAGVLILDRASRTVIATGATQGASDLLSGAFLTNDRLIVGDGLGVARVIDRSTGEQIGDNIVVTNDGNDLWELVRDKNSGIMLTASTDNSVRSWEFSDDALTVETVTEDDDLIRPTDVVLARGGQELIISSGDGRLHRADATTGELIPGGWTAALHTDEVIALETSDNGWLFSLADDQRVQVWQLLGEAAAIDEIIVERGPIHDLALSPSSNLLAATGPEGTTIHDSTTGSLTQDLGGGGESVIFSDNNTVATGSADGLVQLWSAETGALLGQTKAHAGEAIRSIAISPDGELLATGGADGSVSLWNVEGDDVLQAVWGHPADGGEINDLVFTPNGQTVISISFLQQLAFIEVDSGDSSTTLVEMDGPQALAVHPTRDLIAIGESFENVDVLDFDGNVISTMAPHPGGVWDLAFTADGLSIVAASKRNPAQIQLWDWKTAVRLGPAFGEGPEREEPDVVTGPDGTVWSSGTDGVIRRLDVLVQNVGCELSANVMDRDMQQRFLGEETMVSCGYDSAGIGSGSDTDTDTRSGPEADSE